MQEHVATRTSTQARSHAQKFFNKLDKRNQTLENFLADLDLNNMDAHYIMSDDEDKEKDKKVSSPQPRIQTNESSPPLEPSMNNA